MGIDKGERECHSMFVFCLFVYFLSVYLQVGIDEGEGSVTVCLFSVCLSTSSLGYLQVGIDKGEGSVTVCLFCLFVATSRWV